LIKKLQVRAVVFKLLECGRMYSCRPVL